MKISPISTINYNNKQCQPIKKVSFGMKASPIALEYLAALGADMRPSVPEDLFKKPGTVANILKNIIDNKTDNSMSMAELADKMVFYSTSHRLPDSAKAKFINEQIIGGGQEISLLVRRIDDIKNDNDKELFKRALINCYISGAAKNPQVSTNATALYFNFLSPKMSFKEQTYCNYAYLESLK